MNNTTTPKKKKGCLHYILIAIAVIFGVSIIGTALGDDKTVTETNSAAYDAGKALGEAAYDITHQNANAETKKPEAEPEKTVYKAGHYKVGTDIPAGVYYLIEDGIMPYFNVTTDANGDDIVFYSMFSSNYIAEVRDGEYFKLTSCYAVPYEDAPDIIPENGWLSSGFYAVGKDIPAGEYKLEAPENATLPSYSIYADLRNDDLVDFGVLESTQYINVEDGQYLSLTDCRIYIGE